MCDMTHSYVYRDVHMCTVTFICVPRDSYVRSACLLSHSYVCTVMGWLRLVGSLKLQVSFVKEPYTRDDILQKRPHLCIGIRVYCSPYYNRVYSYGVATISRLLKIIGLFCKRAL